MTQQEVLDILKKHPEGLTILQMIDKGCTTSRRTTSTLLSKLAIQNLISKESVKIGCNWAMLFKLKKM